MPLPNPHPRNSVVEPDDTGFSEFAGLVNTKSTKTLGHKALKVASNVEIDDEGKLLRRDGFSLLNGSGNFRGAYATQQQDVMLAVQGTNLVRVFEDGSVVVLQSGLSAQSSPFGFSWTEDAQQFVAYTDGIDSGVVRLGLDWVPLYIAKPLISAATLVQSGYRQALPFNLGARYTANTFRIFATYVTADGRESAPSQVWEVQAAPEAAFIAVTIPAAYKYTNLYACSPGGSAYFLVTSSNAGSFTVNVDKLMALGGPEYPFSTAIEPFPANARQICHYGARLFASEYIPTQDVSVVWMSLPLQHHVFDKTADFLAVQGEVSLMLPTPKGLIIASDSQIMQYTEATQQESAYGMRGGMLTELAPYGVVPGSCGDVRPDGSAYFWTTRGIAKALPYELATEKTFTGDPGVFNHARMFFDHGYCKLMSSTVTGNTTFNQRKQR